MTEPVVQPEAGTFARGPHWLGLVDTTLSADACPGGCLLVEGMGTCEAMRTERRRWCAGYAALVCQVAFDAWDKAGRPQLSEEARVGRLARVIGPPIPRVPAELVLPPVLATAPRTLEGWTVYGPHRQDARGEFYDERQRGLRSVLAGWDTNWGRAADSMPWFALLGPPGTGKTLLLRILARRAAEAGLRVEWCVWTDLVDAVNTAYRAGWDDRDPLGVLAPLEQAELLVLDDVRPTHGSQHEENLAHRIIAKRYGEDRGERRRLLFLSANLSVSELELVIGAAALSRLRGAGKVWVTDWPPHPDRIGEAI